jgi:hypothetical protein
MAISICGGISIGGNVRVTLELPSLVIPLNSDGGLTGWGPQNASIPPNATVIATYPVGSTITFQDGSTSTIADWGDYGAYIDIGWSTTKTGTIFPITLRAQ